MKKIFAILLFTAACGSPAPKTPEGNPSHSAASQDWLALQRQPQHRPPSSGLRNLNHIVVLYLENHSFDNLYGEFAGSNNLTDARDWTTTQYDDGEAYTTLPQPMNTEVTPPVADPRFAADLPNWFFEIDQYAGMNVTIPDLVHRFYQEQEQIDGGWMDRFVDVSDAKGLSMGHYHTAALPLLVEAQNYTLCDNFFHGAFGGSFLNHQWLIAARTPVFPNAPAETKAQLDDDGELLVDGFVTPDDYVVNTAFPANAPYPAGYTAADLIPAQTYETIGDRLSAVGVDWAWYAGGWDDALAGNPDPEFQFHHQPFAYFANYGPNTTGRSDHLKDETDFFAAVAAGALPAVSFIKPIGEDNEHPGYSTIIQSENHALEIINAIRNSSAWGDSVIIVTYDENGGFWDHVPPPLFDRWGPGSRVPTIVISPFARRGFVDSTQYDTTSILALIEHRFQLPALSERDANANDLSSTFSFPH